MLDRRKCVAQAHLFNGFTSSTRLSNASRDGVVVEAVEEAYEQVSKVSKDSDLKRHTIVASAPL